MLRVLFFASIRERLGTAELRLGFEAGATDTVEALIDSLERDHAPGSAKLLRAPNTLVAVNRTVVGRESVLSDGDEVAFYPPVTGG